MVRFCQHHRLIQTRCLFHVDSLHLFTAKFGSVAVVEALLDLLDDQEHDVRATACISLAKSKAGDLSMKIDRLMRCLRDSDRFVRESACVALGYLRAEEAVPVLLQIW